MGSWVPGGLLPSCSPLHVLSCPHSLGRLDCMVFRPPCSTGTAGLRLGRGLCGADGGGGAASGATMAPSVPFLGARDPCLCAQRPPSCTCKSGDAAARSAGGACSCYCPAVQRAGLGSGRAGPAGDQLPLQGTRSPWEQEDRPSLLILWVFCRLQAGGVGRGFVGLWLRAGTAASPGLSPAHPAGKSLAAPELGKSLRAGLVM